MDTSDSSSPNHSSLMAEIEALYQENNSLAAEITRLQAKIKKNRENNKPLGSDKDIERHPSNYYLSRIRSLKKDAPVLGLVKEWREAQDQCTSYAQAIEEIQNYFQELKQLSNKLRAWDT